MPLIHINDIDLYYELLGEGQPLLIINGLSGDISEMVSITTPLAQEFQIIAFDNRGAGRTEKPDAPYSIEMMAEDTAALLRSLQISPVAVMGISMGGRIALQLTLSHPELVSRLILVSTSARVIHSWRRAFRMRFLSLLASARIFQGQYPQPRYAFLRQLQASGSYNCVDRLAEIEQPTLILHAQQDQTAPYLLAEELHTHIPGSQLQAFPGGHIFFLFRQRQPFLDAVRAFLTSTL